MPLSKRIPALPFPCARLRTRLCSSFLSGDPLHDNPLSEHEQTTGERESESDRERIALAPYVKRPKATVQRARQRGEQSFACFERSLARWRWLSSPSWTPKKTFPFSCPLRLVGLSSSSSFVRVSSRVHSPAPYRCRSRSRHRVFRRVFFAAVSTCPHARTRVLIVIPLLEPIRVASSARLQHLVEQDFLDLPVRPNDENKTKQQQQNTTTKQKPKQTNRSECQTAPIARRPNQTGESTCVQHSHAIES